MSIALGMPSLPSTSAYPAAWHDRPGLHDAFGRQAADLRVSLTDRCNLRCSYCMPAEGLPWLADQRLLSDDEVVRLITIAVRDLQVTKIRFTGGEPLLRRGLVDIVAATTALTTHTGQPVHTALTTNGLGLNKRAAALAGAGLGRVNVSLDTLRPDRFATITHRDRHADVLAGLRGAEQAGLAPVKVNAVLLRGVNDDEALDLLTWALEHGYRLRFIEQMPLDAQGSWQRDRLITAEQILSSLRQGFRLEPCQQSRGAAPAEEFDVYPLQPSNGSAPLGRVGVIASVTRPFCSACDRTRLTADGQLRNCLFARKESDLRQLLRSGADDTQIADAWRANAAGKLAGHGIGTAGFTQPDRGMNAIGG